MDSHNLIALLLVAAFACAALLFWFAVHTVKVGIDRYREKFSETAKVNLAQMFLFIEPHQLLTLNLSTGTLFAIVMFFVLGPVAAGISALLVFLTPGVLFRFFRWRRTNLLRGQLPDAAMLMAGALRAGASVPTAIAQMAAEIRPPLAQEFDLFLREQRLGVGFEQALDNLEQRVALEDMALFSSAMRVSRETGGNLAETLERLAETLRQKLTIEGKIRSLTAQGKLQGFIVGLLPFGLMFVLFKMEPAAMSQLFTTWYGLTVIGFIVVMEFIGALVIKKIVTIDV
jgi:tight adherence protein B